MFEQTSGLVQSVCSVVLFKPQVFFRSLFTSLFKFRYPLLASYFSAAVDHVTWHTAVLRDEGFSL